MLEDGGDLLLEHHAEGLVLVFEDAIEEQCDVLLSVARLANVKKILNDLRIADEACADLVGLAVPDKVALLEQAVAHLHTEEEQQQRLNNFVILNSGEE